MIALPQFIEPATGWIAALLILSAWWIKGLADRKRASTEGVVAEHGVSMELIGLLQNEIARLNERVSALEVGNHTKDTTINDLTAAMLAKTAEIAAQKITHGAEMAAESLLKMAALAEASVLRSRLAHESGLVEAAQEQAHQTERIANATEQVVETAKVTQIGKGKP